MKSLLSKKVAGLNIAGNPSASQVKTALALNNVSNDAQVKRSEMGAHNGVATLDDSGKVEYSQLRGKYLHCITLSTYPAPGQTRIMFSLLSERNYAYSFYSSNDIAEIMESIRGIIMGGNGPSNCRWLPAAVCVTPMGPTAMEAAAIQYDDALSRLLLNRPNYGGQILWDFNDQMNNQYSFYPDACGSFLM